MRKTFVVLSFFCVLISCGFCGEYGGGDGTADNPYQIASVEHLVELGKTQSDYESHFILIADLDMAGTVYKRAIIAPDLDDKEWGPRGARLLMGYSTVASILYQTLRQRTALCTTWPFSGILKRMR